MHIQMVWLFCCQEQFLRKCAILISLEKTNTTNTLDKSLNVTRGAQRCSLAEDGIKLFYDHLCLYIYLRLISLQKYFFFTTKSYWMLVSTVICDE